MALRFAAFHETCSCGTDGSFCCGHARAVVATIKKAKRTVTASGRRTGEEFAMVVWVANGGGTVVANPGIFGAHQWANERSTVHGTAKLVDLGLSINTSSGRGGTFEQRAFTSECTTSHRATFVVQCRSIIKATTRRSRAEWRGRAFVHRTIGRFARLRGGGNKEQDEANRREIHCLDVLLGFRILQFMNNQQISVCLALKKPSWS
jgi:hypothetical protein